MSKIEKSFPYAIDNPPNKFVTLLDTLKSKLIKQKLLVTNILFSHEIDTIITESETELLAFLNDTILSDLSFNKDVDAQLTGPDLISNYITDRNVVIALFTYKISLLITIVNNLQKKLYTDISNNNLSDTILTSFVDYVEDTSNTPFFIYDTNQASSITVMELSA